MANTFKGVLILLRATDDLQQSFEEATCLASVSGDSSGVAVIDFVKEDIFEDTLT